MTLLEQILVSIITALTTAVLAYFGFWRQAQAELKKEYASRFNEKKWETYIRFVSLIPKLVVMEVLGPSNQAELTKLDTEITDEYKKIDPVVWLIGSPNVVESYIEWKKLTGGGNFSEREMQFASLIKLINTMREDLGKENADLDYKVFEGEYFVPDRDTKSNH